MINRFSRVQPAYQPYFAPTEMVKQMPDLTGLEAQLDKYQAMYNEAKNYTLPEYIRESPSDTKAFNNYVTTLDGYKEKAIQALTEKRLGEGISALRSMKDYQDRAKQPGGDFYELQKNANQFALTDKELKETFLNQKSDKYDPYMYSFARKKLVSSLGEFKDELGNYRTGVNSPTLAKYYNEKEINDFFNDYLDNITADQVAYGPHVSSLKGVPFKKLLNEGSLEYIDRNKVARILAQAVTPQIAAHFSQLGEAYGLTDNQGQLLPQMDKKGNIQGFSSDTMLGKTLNALIDSKVYTKEKRDSKVVADSYSEALALEDAKEQKKMATTQMDVFSRAGLPDWDLTINSSGTITKTQKVPYVSNRGVTLYENSKQPIDIKFKDYIKSEEFKKSYPMGASLAQHYAPTIEKMTDKEANEFLKNKYEEVNKKMQTDSYTFNRYVDKDQAKDTNELLWGSPESNSLGMASNFTAIVFEQGKNPRTVPITTLVEQTHEGSMKDFRKSVYTGGEVTSNNPYVASGYQSSVIDKNGNAIKFVLTPKSLEDAQAKEQWVGFYSVLDPSVNESPLSYTGIPEVDAYGPSKSKGINIYQSDLMWQQLQRQKDNLTPEEYKNEYKKISELKGTSQDEFVKRDAILVTQDGTELGTVSEFATEYELRRN